VCIIHNCGGDTGGNQRSSDFAAEHGFQCPGEGWNVAGWDWFNNGRQFSTLHESFDDFDLAEIESQYARSKQSDIGIDRHHERLAMLKL
jgi:hypothetical protein